MRRMAREGRGPSPSSPRDGVPHDPGCCCLARTEGTRRPSQASSRSVTAMVRGLRLGEFHRRRTLSPVDIENSSLVAHEEPHPGGAVQRARSEGGPRPEMPCATGPAERTSETEPVSWGRAPGPNA